MEVRGSNPRVGSCGKLSFANLINGMAKGDNMPVEEKEVVSPLSIDDALTAHRIEMFEHLGFSLEDSEKLIDAVKIVEKQEFPITWHDVAKLQKAGATNQQILDILL